MINHIDKKYSLNDYPTIKKHIEDVMFLLKTFLQEEDIKVEVADIPTASFNPFTKKITIGEFYEDLLLWKNIPKRYKNVPPKLIKFDLFHSIIHEASHYRDLKIEQDRNGKSSMKQLLLKISKKHIEINGQEKLLISNAIHDLYNSLDDIVVNAELNRFQPFDISAEDQKHIYKQILFPSIDQKGNIILSDSVDYSSESLHSQFSDFFLRTFMIPDDTVILDDKLNKIIRSANINISYKKLYKYMLEKETEFKKNDRQRERYDKIKDSFLEKKLYIRNFSLFKYLDTMEKISNAFQGQDFSIKKANEMNFFDLIYYFTKTKGKDDGHHIIIPPYLRYEIISTFFEPLYEVLIIIDWIENGKISHKNKYLINPKDDNKSDQPGYGSGAGGITHDNMDIEEKIRLLDQLEQSDVHKELDDNKQTTRRTLNNVFDNTGIDAKTLNILKKMQEKNQGHIANLSTFLEGQLSSIERKIKENSEKSKKGKLNYDDLIHQITKNPISPNISGLIYDRMDIKEQLKNKFKKMDRIFVVDISGSMSQHKGANGALSDIVHIFSQTLMHLERSLQKLLNDPDYKIPINFILYGDDIGFSTLGNKQWENQPAQFKFAKSFEEIQRLSGGTNDHAGWQKVSDEITSFINENPDYKHEIEHNERRPVIIQLADTDVSTDGIDILTKGINKVGLKSHQFSIKRLILGHYADVITPEGRGDKQLNSTDQKNITIKRQEFVRKKKEIVGRIIKLFENFIQEYE